MKSVLTKGAKFLIDVIASAIVTALITGQSLTGFMRLEGFYKTFMQSRVPAWAFAVVFLIALFASQYAVTQLWRQSKGRVHFVPDAYNCGWSQQGDFMNVRIGGTFTYEGTNTLVVLTAFLQGTKSNEDLRAQVDGPNGRLMGVSQLWLEPSVAHRVFMHFRVVPLLGAPGKQVLRRLVFRDKYNRCFLIGPINFPYIGPKVDT